MARARTNRRADRRRANRAAPKPRGGIGPTIGWSALLLGALALTGFGFYAYRAETSGDAIDFATLCPAEGGARGSLLVLLDLTDPLSPVQSDRLRNVVDDAVDGAPRGTLFAIGRVDSDPAAWGARIAICKPMTGAEAGDWVRNSEKVEEIYRTKFREPLDAVLREALAAQPADTSPIAEALQALVVGADAIPTAPDAPRQIIIVSDLIQNSEAMSFFRGEDWESFRDSDAYGRMSESLGGSDIRIWRLPRLEAPVDMAEVDDFWVNYLEAQGVVAIHAKTLGDL